MLSGWISEDGQMMSGDDAWREGTYYADPNNGGRLVINSWAYIYAEDPDNEERDGDGYWFFFDGSGKKVTDKVNKTINGRRMEADPDMRYEIYEYDGESYLISSSGKIMKNRTNIKDGDGYYYCADKKGIVIYQGEDRYKKD